MLSRVAGSLYRIGRMVERADQVARVVDVHLTLALDRGREPARSTATPRSLPPSVVRVAVGRDYHDVPPIRGTYVGASREAMEVTVTTRVL
jgi:uncharacterized alpha-E superfamily protein